jgi:hypothetical protein
MAIYHSIMNLAQVMTRAQFMASLQEKIINTFSVNSDSTLARFFSIGAIQMLLD